MSGQERAQELSRAEFNEVIIDLLGRVRETYGLDGECDCCDGTCDCGCLCHDITRIINKLEKEE